MDAEREDKLAKGEVFTRKSWPPKTESIFLSSYLPSEIESNQKVEFLKMPPRGIPWELYGSIFFLSLALCWR